MRDAQLGRRYTLVLQKQESTLSLLSSIGETAQPIMSMPLWRNRLARSAVNREAGGSSPPRGAIFFGKKITNFVQLAKKKQNYQHASVAQSASAFGC